MFPEKDCKEDRQTNNVAYLDKYLVPNSYSYRAMTELQTRVSAGSLLSTMFNEFFLSLSIVKLSVIYNGSPCHLHAILLLRGMLECIIKVFAHNLLCDQQKVSISSSELRSLVWQHNIFHLKLLLSNAQPKAAVIMQQMRLIKLNLSGFMSQCTH